MINAPFLFSNLHKRYSLDFCEISSQPYSTYYWNQDQVQLCTESYG